MNEIDNSELYERLNLPSSASREQIKRSCKLFELHLPNALTKEKTLFIDRSLMASQDDEGEGTYTEDNATMV